MDKNAIQKKPISKRTEKLLYSIGITDITEADNISLSSLKHNLLHGELEKIIYELIPLECLHHPEGEIFIYDIPMTKRLLHVLANHDVYYLSSLSKYTLKEILQFRNLGSNTFQELKKICEEYNIPLPT